MRFRQLRWSLAVAIAIVGMCTAGSVLAQNYYPFSVDQIHSLADVTATFNPHPLSTVDAIHQTTDGDHLDVTFRVGQNSDPFGANFGDTFARISLNDNFTSIQPDNGLNLNAYDGVKWCLMSDVPLHAQPFIQSQPNWNFVEVNSDQPGGMVMYMLTVPFGSPPGAPADTKILNAAGLQLGWGFGTPLVPITPGNPVWAHIWITQWVP